MKKFKVNHLAVYKGKSLGSISDLTLSIRVICGIHVLYAWWVLWQVHVLSQWRADIFTGEKEQTSNVRFVILKIVFFFKLGKNLPGLQWETKKKLANGLIIFTVFISSIKLGDLKVSSFWKMTFMDINDMESITWLSAVVAIMQYNSNRIVWNPSITLLSWYWKITMIHEFQAIDAFSCFSCN